MQPVEQSSTGARLTRRRALAIAGTLGGVLGLGWLADALAGLPSRGSQPGGRVLQPGSLDVTVALSPADPMAGAETSITVQVHDQAGQRVAPTRFRGTLLMPAMGMDPIEPVWEAITLGQYRVSVTFPMAGAWTLVVTITDASQHAATMEYNITVR